MADNDGSAEIALSPWSCFNCRRRKVRCDRRRPCSHCSRGSLACSFPVSGRTPSRRYDPSLPNLQNKAELLGRLRHLEGIISELSSQLQEDDGSRSATNSSGRAQMGASNTDTASEQYTSSFADMPKFVRQLGHLVTHNNQSLYIKNTLWTAICDEVQHIQKSLDGQHGDKNDSSEFIAQRLDSPTERAPFFWGHEFRGNQNLQLLPSQVPFIWLVFLENVDPFIKVLHVPTMSESIKESKGRFGSMTPSMEALMFAISLAAVNSLSDEEITENFNDDKGGLLSRLTLGTEQALSRAGVLHTTDMRIVQAFTIYLHTVEQRDGPRAIWTLAGLLLRTALSMGLHRDSAHFVDMSPFEAEMRRRLWWNICFLDARVGDCQVFESGISPGLFDTRNPINLDDADLQPDMSKLPPARDGFTNATYCVMQCEMWRYTRRMRMSMAARPDAGGRRERRRMLEEVRERLIRTFYRKVDGKNPLHVYIQTMDSVSISAWGLVEYVVEHSPRSDSPPSPSPTTTGTAADVGNEGEDRIPTDAQTKRDEIFLTAVASLHHVAQLQTQPMTRKWAWTLRDNVQWHAMTALLSQLHKRAWGPTCELGWRLVQHAIAEIGAEAHAQNHPMRSALLKLAGGVAHHRSAEMRRLGLPLDSGFVAKGGGGGGGGDGEGGGLGERLAQLGPLVIPGLHDARTNGRIGFDLEAAQQRLTLEMEVSRGAVEPPSLSSSTLSANNPGAGSTLLDDMWIDLGMSPSGLDMYLDGAESITVAASTNDPALGPHCESLFRADTDTNLGVIEDFGFQSFPADETYALRPGEITNESANGADPDDDLNFPYEAFKGSNTGRVPWWPL